MSLVAPLAVAVELRTTERRVFRLSRNVSEAELTLARPAPFEVGQPVTVQFTLADAAALAPLIVRAVVTLTDDDGEGEGGGRALTFVDPPREARIAIAGYVAGRLGLPRGTAWR